LEPKVKAPEPVQAKPAQQQQSATVVTRKPSMERTSAPKPSQPSHEQSYWKPPQQFSTQQPPANQGRRPSLPNTDFTATAATKPLPVQQVTQPNDQNNNFPPLGIPVKTQIEASHPAPLVDQKYQPRFQPTHQHQLQVPHNNQNVQRTPSPFSNGTLHCVYVTYCC
jgi:hypothetical protein